MTPFYPIVALLRLSATVLYLAIMGIRWKSKSCCRINDRLMKGFVVSEKPSVAHVATIPLRT